jgi:hypothetical protein
LKKGELYEQHHRTSSAIKAYERIAKTKDPAVAGPANLNLGRLYEQHHRTSSAIKAYERVIKLGGSESKQANLALVRLRG